MNRRTLLAVLGTLLTACDQTNSPVAPSAVNDGGVTAVGPGGPVYTARGTAIDATLLGLNTKISDCNLPPGGGGNIAKNVASHTIPGKLFTKLLYCNAQGQNNQSLAEAGVYELILTVGGNTIFADVLTSMAAARCPQNGGGYTTSGSSHIARLNVNGQAHVVGTAPNHVINLPNGYIVINEQSSFVTPFHAGRTVTALRVVIPGLIPIDLKFARSQTHIDCP